MKRVLLLHTVRSVYESFEPALRAACPEPLILYNQVDEFFVMDTAEHGGKMSDVNRERLSLLLKSCDLTGVDLIVVTCSQLSPWVRGMKAAYRTPIIEIDDEMTRRAVDMGQNIAVFSTMAGTVPPVSERLRENAQKRGREITLRPVVCEEAMAALRAGNKPEHDRLVVEAASGAKGCDVIVLAQASTAHLHQDIQSAYGIPVIDSPASCIAQAVALLTANNEVNFHA